MLKNGLVKLRKKHNCYSTSSAEQTSAVAVAFAKTLKPGDVLALFGQLGAGKTTFVKAIAQEITGIAANAVNSPTFQYLNIYPGSTPFYHFDLYRLRGAEDFLSMGFEELFYSGGICCIEWAERIQNILPPNVIRVSIHYVGEDIRKIYFEEPISCPQ